MPLLLLRKGILYMSKCLKQVLAHFLILLKFLLQTLVIRGPRLNIWKSTRIMRVREVLQLNHPERPWQTLSQHSRDEIAGQIGPGETLLAWFEPDLDSRLHYSPGLVVLTDRRVLARDGAASSGWQSWGLEADVRLVSEESAGVGT